MLDTYEMMDIDLHDVPSKISLIGTNRTKTQMERLNELQVENNAGGYCYKVDDLGRVMRFLILGADGATYYSGDKPDKLKRENVECIDRLILAERGPAVVDCIKKVSVNGRACKKNPLIYALAICARSNDPETKTAAYKVLSDVCRIPTHLFLFIRHCEDESSGTGWGRAHKKAISDWYTRFNNDPKRLAYLVTKFRNRHGWCHKDLIRLAHVKCHGDSLRFLIRYLVKGLEEAKNTHSQINSVTGTEGETMQLIKYLEAVEQAHACNDENVMVDLIDKFGLVREHVPTELLNSANVWQALIWKMPMMALIRNLGKMSHLELLDERSENEKKVVYKLTNKDKLLESKIHPFMILTAWNQYKKGHGDKGKLAWVPNKNIVNALEEAFHLSFVNVKPTGKRFMLAVDVSGSMNCPVIGNTSVTAREAAAAMMMVTARAESDFEVVAFSRGLTHLNITSEDSLQSVMNKCNGLYFSMTDCSLPITHAMEYDKKIDAFIVYTDSETYSGRIHPSDALVSYRRRSGIPDAKLVVVGMASNGFTIADPTDPFMMDVVGFDAEAPQAIESFVSGDIL